jgi:hypothetical protein
MNRCVSIIVCLLLTGCSEPTLTQSPPDPFTIQTTSVGQSSPNLGKTRPILTNHSDQPIRIWNPNTEGGYYALSFHLTNSRSGETCVARKRRIDDAGFWEALKDGIEPGSRSRPKVILVHRFFSAISNGESSRGQDFHPRILRTLFQFPRSSNQ